GSHRERRRREGTTCARRPDPTAGTFAVNKSEPLDREEKMAKKTIAFVVYPGVSLLELVGNHTLLSSIMGLGPRMKLKAGYESVVVGECLKAIPTDTPMSIIPQRTFADLPQPEGLVVIGGGADTLSALEHAELVEYVRRAGERAGWVASTS